MSFDSTAHAYSTREAARIFGLKENRLRYWATTGFISPSGRKRGRRAYTFNDLVEVKAAKQLLDAGVPLQRVRRNLQALRETLPGEQGLLGRLSVRSDGDQLVVVDGDAVLDPLSGQTILDFDISAVQQEIAHVLELRVVDTNSNAAPEADRTTATAEPADSQPGLPAASAQQAQPEQHSTAYRWFLRGLELDESEATISEAIRAYQTAIELDPGLAAAYTNLGNLYYRLERSSEALRYYEQACSIDPEQPEACYNLANIYEDEGDLEMAIATYRQALKSDPNFADTHFNLALALEQVGGKKQAKNHWQRYLDLAPATEGLQPWRSLAEQHLR